MNEIAKESNAALPVLNSAAPSYERLLETLEPFGNQLASSLADYHPDFARLLKDGDNISLLLLEHRQQVVDLVKGLASFFFTLSRDSTQALPNGTHFDYFQTFVMFSQVNDLVCSLLAPLQPGLSFLEPLQQAVAGAGTPLDCSKRFSAFDALQESQDKPAVSQVPGSQPVQVKNLPEESSIGPLSNITSIVKELETTLDEGLGKPPAEHSEGIGKWLQGLLGSGGSG